MLKILKSKRVISAFVALIIVIPIFISITLGGMPGRASGFVLLSVASVYATYEFIKHMELSKVTKILVPLVSLFVMFFDRNFTTLSLIKNNNPQPFTMQHMFNVYTLFLPAIALTLIFLDPLVMRSQNILKIFMFTIFATVFPAVFFKIFFILNVLDWKFAIGLISIAIISDVFAFFGGMLLHKKFPKKFAPKISPKKTWAGFLTGYILAVLFTVLYFVLVKFNDQIHLKTITIIFMVLLLPLASPIGDLIFSAFKRDMQIKDFSNIMPGHGGILDRIDSWILIFFTFSLIYQIFSLI